MPRGNSRGGSHNPEVRSASNDTSRTNSNRGLASASEATRTRVARLGGQASRGGGRTSKRSGK